MILGDVEEVVTTVEIDDETYEEIVRVSWQSAKKRKYTFILIFGKSLNCTSVNNCWKF